VRPKCGIRAKPYKEDVKAAVDAFEPYASTELVPVTEDTGLKIADDVVSRVDLPSKDIYDGYAVRREDMEEASPSSLVALKVLDYMLRKCEEGYEARLSTAVYAASGAPLLRGAGAMVRKRGAAEERGYRKGRCRHTRGIADQAPGRRAAYRAGGAEGPCLSAAVDRSGRRGKRDPRQALLGRPVPRQLPAPPGVAVQAAEFRACYLGTVSDEREEITEFAWGSVGFYDALAPVGGASIGIDDTSCEAVGEVAEVALRVTTPGPGEVLGVARLRGKTRFLVPSHIGPAMACVYNLVVPVKAYYGGRIPRQGSGPGWPRAWGAGSRLHMFRLVRLAWEDGVLKAAPYVRLLSSPAPTSVLSCADGYMIMPPSAILEGGGVVEVTLPSSIEGLCPS